MTSSVVPPRRSCASVAVYRGPPICQPGSHGTSGLYLQDRPVVGLRDSRAASLDLAAPTVAARPRPALPPRRDLASAATLPCAGRTRIITQISWRETPVTPAVQAMTPVVVRIGRRLTSGGRRAAVAERSIVSRT